MTVELSVTEPQVCLDSMGCLFEFLQVDPGTTAIPEYALRGFGEHRQCFQMRQPVMVLQALILPGATVILVGCRMPAAHTARIGQILVKRNSCFQTQIGFPKCQEVVPIAEAFNWAQLKVTQAD